MMGALRRFRTLLTAAALVPVLVAGPAAVAQTASQAEAQAQAGREPVRILRDE